MYVNDHQCMSRLFNASSTRELFDTEKWPHVTVVTKICIASTKKMTHVSGAFINEKSK